MKWLVVALFATSGCRLEIVDGTADSARATSASSAGTSAGAASAGPTASGGSSGATSSSGTAVGGNTTGETGTTGEIGGSSSGGKAGGGSTSNGTTTGGGPACDAGLTFCNDSTISGVSQGCFDTSSDPLNCGTCANDCATSYGTGSGCRFGLCSCAEPVEQLCTEIPSGSPPSCDCIPVGTACASPTFARDVYPFLAQQQGVFGCAASGCHSGAAPAAELAFLDPAGEMDAGMAYLELIGTGPATPGVCGCQAPLYNCDAGVPAGDPAFECPCVSRVAPGNIYASYLIDALANDLPGACATLLPMPPPVGNQDWVPVPACSLQLVEQWVATGAAQ